MIALVTYPYRDRETLAVHLVGEEVELTEARFAELSAGGYVDLPPAEPEAAADTAEDAPAEAADGFAPRKATKAELAAILEAL